jgi:dienelactone hydrolase
MDSAFVYYYIKRFGADFENERTYSDFDVLDTLQNYETMSYYSSIPINSNYPVIIYHHGYAGNSDENFVLAEYFASKGYIVISSNYHLPYENETYRHSEGSENEAINLTKRVIEFARSLTTIDEVYFIGHSWGAQVGFSLLHERGWANAFVSMETTLEHKSTKDIKLEWPSLDSLMHIHEKNYSLPILMFAGNSTLPWEDFKEVNLPFEFFKNISNTQTIHATTKRDFGHSSYCSGFFLRYLYKDQFIQLDTSFMKKQLELYKEHLKLIEDFIKSCRDNYLFDKTKYKDNFSIEKYNANKD